MLPTIPFLTTIIVFLSSTLTLAQQPQPGDAFATRFSGTAEIKAPDGSSQKIIDVNGVVGSLVGVSSPSHPPSGHHWPTEIQSLAVTAGQVGQVFGVAIDDGDPPTIYMSATAAFGLHPSLDKSDWMEGMWGAGGAGAIYKLNPGNDYQPELFSIVTLQGRPNSGASLGNIAYDRWNKQLFVSDMETGIIHKLNTTDGTETGRFDHGVEGRASFFDVVTNAPQSLAPVAFDPGSTPRYADCPGGDYTTDPMCWNVADFRRRIWGMGVYRDPQSDRVRVFYAVWGSQSFGNPDWAEAGDDQRNSIWSVGLDNNGNFVPGDIRRELLVPGFFTAIEDFNRAGGSHPVSDIAFSCDGEMLLAERGGLKNAGLDAEEPFAYPRESRVLRYRRNEAGAWELTGREDVGFYDRKKDNTPYIRANSAGGVDFGYGYNDEWLIDPGAPDEFVWMTGDGLCSPDGPCYNPVTNSLSDTSNVSGLQGTPSDLSAEVLPQAALLTPYQEPGPPTPPTGPLSSYMIDLNKNVDEGGNPIPGESARNDSTFVGDVEVYRPEACAPPPQPGIIHLPVGSQPGVVVPPAPPVDHWPPGSTHWPPGTSHWPPGSYHWPIGSGHWPQGSGHWPKGSGHWPPGSQHLGKPSIHWPPGSIIHKGKPSLHWPPGSKHIGKPSLHWPPGSVVHKGKPSLHFPIGSFHKNKPSLHFPPGSVHLGKPSLHFPPGSKHIGKPSLHFPKGSVIHSGKPSLHWPPGSVHKGKPSVHFPPGSKIHVGKPSLHFPAGSIHKGKPSLHFPVGSKVHFPLGSKIHLPLGSVVHKGKPSLHFPPGSKVHTPPGSKVHFPLGSKVHVGKPSLHFPPGSKVHTPPGSKVHFPLGSKVHVGKPSLHFPPGSKVHTPPGSKVHFPLGSKVHVGKPSLHLPKGSVTHTPPGSKVHFPLGSKVHVGKPSLHFPPGSKVATPPGSEVHIPKGSVVHKPPASPGHLPLGSVHTPKGSKVIHQPLGSKVHAPPGSKVIIHQPNGSKVHMPVGSKVHTPPGSKVIIHQPKGSKVHIPVGSNVHTPTGSKVIIHQPKGSKVHLPLGSKKKPETEKKPITRKSLKKLEKKTLTTKKIQTKKDDSSNKKNGDDDSSRDNDSDKKSDSNDSSSSRKKN